MAAEATWANVDLLCADTRSQRFSVLSLAFIFGLGLSCYVEEWIFKALPGFDFYWSVALVELACFAAWAAMQRACSEGLAAAMQRRVPLSLYVGSAVCLGMSQSLGKIAVRYLDYATATILKSGKLLPTLVLSVLWLRRRVSGAEWAAASLLVTSAAFMALGESSVSLDFHPLGLALSFVQLFLAALQGNLQERILKDHDVSISESMLFTNGIGACFVFAVIALNGELRPATAYFASSPTALALLLVRSVTFLAGAIAYSALTKEFGAGASTAVGTARKSLTVLLSFVLFPKRFHVNYVFGVVAFFAADLMYLRVSVVHAAKRAAHPRSPPPEEFARSSSWTYAPVSVCPRGADDEMKVLPASIGSAQELDASKV